ncbi:hypothetical protein D6C86_09762 [Aureobasidium pullulans]|nr:hypothetical protein D6C86_09762 [Aureobasidium pullulans]THZ75904.1 hypothetical protein D6C88_06925 [Aureobasidium pullulans]
MVSDLVLDLLSKLTWEEKVSLLSGADGWHTQEIPRLGIGAIKTTDGPAGARGSISVDGPKAALLSSPVLQAATWSISDMQELGRVLSRETQSKAAQVLLAPTICCHRNPLGGRNFESFSEDPVLSGTLAVGYISGIQESEQVVATVKHFVANEQEHHRFSVDARIDEKTLREIYLRPFEIVIKSHSPPGCVMTAYNLVNGTHMDMHKYLISDVLRDQWGFKGLCMSDWGGTNSTVESVLAGCDLEMPGPTLRRGENLLGALEHKDTDVLKTAINASCARLLSLAERLGKLGLSETDVKASRHAPECSTTSPEDVATLRRIAANGIVLLKNDSNVLPLDPQKLSGKKIAFVGPNALVGASNGGGSAAMNPGYLTHPFNSLKVALKNLGIEAEVHAAQGCRTHKWLPLLSTTQWQADDSETSMLRIDFFASHNCTGDILETQYRNNSSIDLFDSGPESLRDGGEPYSFRMTSVLTPATDGNHTFSVSSVGGARLFVGDDLVLDNSDWNGIGETFYSFGSPELLSSMSMSVGRSYKVVLEAWSKTNNAVKTDSIDVEPMHVYGAQPSTRLGFLEEDTSTIAEAITLADKSDVCIVVLGLNDEWESEGYDRPSMGLPGDQDKLVEDILASTRHPERIIIVNQSGSPLEMPWADRAHTILQTWYGGQEAGNALADVLLGIARPKGRLPMTWPKAYSDLPFATDKESWPGVDDKVVYKEGNKIGYRWHLDAGVAPQWWFGFGLDYTTFDSTVVSVVTEHDRWDICVRILNIGLMIGEDVVQVYVWPSQQPRAKRLIAFERTESIEPRDSITVKLTVHLRDVAEWSEQKWLLQRGSYAIGVGKHAGDSEMATKFIDVRKALSWDP